MGEVIVLIFMTVRFADGSYQPGGKFYTSTQPEYRPEFPDGVDLWGVSVATFVLLNSLSTAFLAHYNAPQFYSQLRDRSPARFCTAVCVAFVICFIIYAWVMTVGYLTFGTACDGLIINNYSNDDPGAMVSRVATLIAVICAFPLAFTALRETTFSTLGLNESRKRVFCAGTVLLLAPITVLGCLLNDLGFVNSLGGALLGSTITLIFPSLLCYLAATRVARFKHEARVEKWLSIPIICLGVVIVVLGSAISVINRYFPEALDHDV